MNTDSQQKSWAKILEQIFTDQAICWPTMDTAEQQAFCDYTFEQGIQPLLHDKLTAIGALQAAPAIIQTTLTTRLLQQTVLQAMMERALKTMLDRAAQAGIQLLLLKGTPLSYTHYAQPILRPSADFDLLIEKKDLPGFTTIMFDLGYQIATAVDGETIRTQETFYQVDASGTKLICDVHWHLFNEPIFTDSFSFAQLQAHSIAVPQIHPQARTLNAIDSILLACIHRIAHHHHEDRLIWLYDIHLLIETMTDAEQSQFAQQSLEKKVARLCYQSLRSSQQWFNTRVPTALLAQLQNVSVPEPSEIYLHENIRSIDLFLSKMKHLSIGKRLQLIFETLFPSPSYIMHRYHTNNRLLLPWLYLHRSIMGLKKWLRPL